MKKFISALILVTVLYFMYEYYILYGLLAWGFIELIIDSVYKRKFFKSSLGLFGEVLFTILAPFDAIMGIVLQVPMNRLLLKDGEIVTVHKFGKWRDTISRVLGIAERDGNLSEAGDFVVRFLNWIEKDHCKKSI